MNIEHGKFDSFAKKGSLILIIALAIVGMASGNIVTNSQDWTDVMTGMQVGDYENRTPYFAQTQDGSALLQEVPTGSDIRILQSNTDAYLPNLENQFDVNGYNVEEVQTFTSNTELIPEDVEDFVLVSRSDPQASIPAVSLANALDSWTIAMDNENQENVADFVNERGGEVRTVGSFSTPQENLIEEEIEVAEEFSADSKFELSVDILERIEEEQEIDSLILTDGRGFERDMFTSDNPVLLTGSNFLSEEAESYAQENQNIETVVVLGADMANVGEDLEDSLSEDRNVSTVLKFAQASPSGVQQQAVGISFFSLPGSNPELEILSAQYIPNQNQFITTFNNPSAVGVYETSSITIVDSEGETVNTLGDDSSQFIPSESTSTVTYDDVDLGDDISGYEAEFTTTYGSEEDNQNTYVPSSEEDVFEPPRVLDISVLDLNDQSELEISDGYYSPEDEELGIELNNTGSVDTYAQATVQDLRTQGSEETLSSNLTTVEAGETETVDIEASLTEEDIQSIDSISVEAEYGERENFLIKTAEAELDFRVQESGLNYTIVVLVILVVLALLYLLKEVRDELNDEE